VQTFKYKLFHESLNMKADQ